MSLIIKDMEMPTVGRILITFPSGRTLEVSADNTQNILGEAKAVPVPPHGRLIDADALKETFRIGMENATPLFTSGLVLSLAEDVIKALMEDIDEAPTIIVADREEETCQT